MAVYAWICDDCKHRIVQHRLAPDAPDIDGPYRCLHCDCQIDQRSPSFSVTRAEFERRYRPLEETQL